MLKVVICSSSFSLGVYCRIIALYLLIVVHKPIMHSYMLTMTFVSFAGIDIPELYNVVHYGPASSLDEYIQETGRAGRDGGQSHAILIYLPNSLKGKYVTDDIIIRVFTC